MLPAAARRGQPEGLLGGATQGVFSVFSSDHCPFRYDDPQGKLTPKGRTSFRWVPNGIPGVATRLPILFSEGVVKGRIDLNRFVALTSTNHARTYGLYPRKGTIAVGADADIVLWDRDRRVIITHERLQDGSDYTPYEGLEVTGWPVLTMVRGRVLCATASSWVPKATVAICPENDLLSRKSEVGVGTDRCWKNDEARPARYGRSGPRALNRCEGCRRSSVARCCCGKPQTFKRSGNSRRLSLAAAT